MHATYSDTKRHKLRSQRTFVSPRREVDYSKCSEPLYKCDLCCSVAVYRCPDYYQCEKHHGQGSKTVEPCPGMAKCPLGCEHPQNARIKRGFIIGCNCDKCKLK